MDDQRQYDCAVVGGGIAGLCLAIQLARKNISVILFEKQSFPFHKVCGEYISNESLGFFTALGLPIHEWKLPQIHRLGISSARGFMMEADLELGGFGLSRFRLDAALADLARRSGVRVEENCKVHDAGHERVVSSAGEFTARIVVSAFGKLSPAFAPKEKRTGKNFIGVKYHIRSDFPADRIELHNFPGGYCGISKIEDERYCLCYLSEADNLKRSGNSIAEMERKVLYQNPHLRQIFSQSEFLFETPVTVSNIKFNARSTHYNGMLFMGDAAGCISPLTGNGMSMAARSSFIAAPLIVSFLNNCMGREDLFSEYHRRWASEFGGRIERGRSLQWLFSHGDLCDLTLRLLNPLGKVKHAIISSTHGQPF